MFTVFLSICLQVPCFVFDSDGKKHDLNPLIKVSGGYLVDDGDDTIDFYINICRNLSECFPSDHVDTPMDFIDSKLGNLSCCNYTKSQSDSKLIIQTRVSCAKDTRLWMSNIISHCRKEL